MSAPPNLVWPAGPATPARAPRSTRRKRHPRGLGRVYRQKVKDPATGKRRETGPWWIQFTWNGKRQRESSGSYVKEDAVNLLKSRLGDVQSGRYVAGAARVKVKDLLDGVVADYEAKGRRTTVRLRQHHKALLRHLGPSMTALEVTQAKVLEYTAARSKEGVASGTIRLELSALRRALRLGAKYSRLAVAPTFDLPPSPDARTGFFEEDELASVVKHLPNHRGEHLVPAVRFMAISGWRKEEALGLTWAEVDLKAGVIRIEGDRTKNREARTIPYRQHPELDAIIRGQREAVSARERAESRIIPWVFPGRKGERIKSTQKAWRGACKDAGIPGKLIHDLRRTATRNMERAGIPRSVAMKITGHKTESVYKRYAIVSERDLAEALQRLHGAK